MVNIIPSVEINDVEKNTFISTGYSSNVAVIGSFGIDDNTIKVFDSLNNAKKALKGETEPPSTALGYHALDYLFSASEPSKGIGSLLVANTTTTTEESALDYTLSPEKLADALALLDDEVFDILYIATEQMNITDLTSVATFIKAQYKKRKPLGLIVSVGTPTSEQQGQIKTAFKDLGAYKLITTPVHLREDTNPLSLANSAAWHTAYTAGLPVKQSETQKVYKDLQGNATKDIPGVNVEDYVSNGLFAQEISNRNKGITRCLHALTPTGRDLAVERIKNYMVNRLALREALGEQSNPATKDYISGLIEAEKLAAINNGIIKDMSYSLSYIATDELKLKCELVISNIITKVTADISLTYDTSIVEPQED